MIDTLKLWYVLSLGIYMSRNIFKDGWIVVMVLVQLNVQVVFNRVMEIANGKGAMKNAFQNVSSHMCKQLE